MNSNQSIKTDTDEISVAIKQRYEDRRAQRVPRLAEAMREGPFAAAPRLEAMARTSHLTAIEGRNLEATSGNYDIDQVNFLSRGLKAARSVCRITNAGTSWGTGFLVAPGLLITNNHVLPDSESAAACAAEFNYEYDAEDNALPRKTFQLAPGKVFITSSYKKLDFTIVAIADEPGASQAFGWLPLDPRENKIVAGEPAVSIEHPGQEDKKICLFDSFLVDKIPDSTLPYLHYTTDTEKGSSGSPVFNRNWQVIALHHGSFTTQETDPATGRAKDVAVNEGIRVSRLINGLRTGDGIDVGDQAMRDAVLSRLLAPSTLGNSRPQGPRLARAPDLASTASEVSAAMGAKLIFRPEGNATLIKTPSLARYAGRKGYQETFLGSGALRVPLPTLAPAMQDDVAPLLRSATSSVLKYTHYSVVMCASRRIAYFSACNIDGATNPVSFDRKLRLEFESTRPEIDLERAADQWYYDPRMALEYQPGPELFDDYATKFDFGHITRRMDAVWGDDDERLRGSDDTFHMTNCSPQVSSYNQHGDWGSLEDAVAKFARGKGAGDPARRVTVISGPVLHPSDLELLGVQVPGSYWKVIAFEEDGELRSLAFLTSQRELVDVEREKLESTKELVKTAFDNEWLSTVKDVSRLTSLDFGPLVQADYFAAQGGHKERITEALLARLFG